jgi:hypothetical protein
VNLSFSLFLSPSQEGGSIEQAAMVDEVMARDYAMKEQVKKRQAILHDLTRDVVAMVTS